MISTVQRNGRRDPWASVPAVLVISISTLALVGWATGLERLPRVYQGSVAMNPMTALAFALTSLSLLMLPRSRGEGGATKREGRTISGALAAVAAFIGALRFLEYVTPFEFGIDRILFAGRLGNGENLLPNRMAPNTAMGFVLIGSSILCLDRRSARLRNISQAFALVAGFTGILAFVGHLFGVSTLYAVTRTIIGMAVNTAACFILLSLGVLAARPDRGVAAVVASQRLGGGMARRLLPAALIVPPLLGWIRLQGQKAGMYGTEFGLALFVMLLVTSLSVFVLWTSRAIDRMDAEREQIAAEKERYAEQLEETNKELEAFSYSVSHDLRAPLRHIDGYVSLLNKSLGPRLGEKDKRYLDTVADSAKQMGRLIDDLLVFSRMGRTEMKSAAIDTARLIGEVVREVTRAEEERSIEWDIRDLPTVSADPSMLRLVWINLLSNAVKYTRPKSPARIEIGGKITGVETVFSVRDNGVGFDMQYVHRLFGVFQRLHSATEFEGTGIGLANVRRIVHRHGGRTWAESTLGEGAAFYFSLPNGKEGS